MEDNKLENDSKSIKVGMDIHILIAFIQTILHYLGWICIVLGAIALIFGNLNRAIELIVGGFGWFVLKYLIGFIYMFILSVVMKKIKK